MATRCITKSCAQFHSSSALRGFIQLHPQRSLQNGLLLDFLVPTVPSRALHASHHQENQFSCSKKGKGRSLTSSAIRNAASVLVNPRKDDDGKDMHVDITPRASKRLREIMTKDANPNLALRIQVESGGCHGFQYLMSLTTLPPNDSYSTILPGEVSLTPEGLCNRPNATPSGSSNEPSVSGTMKTSGEVERLDEDDTVFAANDGSGAMIVMDGPSLDLLTGSKVDYTMELIGSQFKIVDNPLATSSCGCGTSFDIKT